jgi:TolA-binding protein
LAADPQKKEDILKRQVEAAYSLAEDAKNKNDNEVAARHFLRIIQEYPNYSRLDIVYFNAADAQENLWQYQAASNTYLEMQNRFPHSKYAIGALINAAADLDTIKAYPQEIVVYEKLLAQYPRAKEGQDALFNIALIHEKTGQFELAAATNERYAVLFPDAQDVDRMLFESGKFFLKAKNYPRALKIFQRYLQKYQGTAKEIEARASLADIYETMADTVNHRKTLDELLTRNEALRSKKNNDDYFAGEALYQLSRYEVRDYYLIRPDTVYNEKKVKEWESRKIAVRNLAIKRLQDVIKLKSSRTFEAFYQIGKIWEDFAYILYKQPRDPKLTGIKQIVAEKNLGEEVIVPLLEQGLKPLEKTLEVRAQMDSLALGKLKPAELTYIDSAKQLMGSLYLRVAFFARQTATLFVDAPIPDQAKVPPAFYLYRLKVIETVIPILEAASKKYLDAADKIKQFRISEKWYVEALTQYAECKFSSVNLKDLVAIDIAENPLPPPKGLSEEEAEEITFQLDDIAMELQDAIVDGYETIFEDLKEKKLTNNPYYLKTLERLAKLDPDKYAPKDIFMRTEIVTDASWLASNRADSGWTLLQPTDSTYKPVSSGRFRQAVKFDSIAPLAIWGEARDSAVFFRQLFHLKGKPVRARVYLTAADNYVVYLNQKRIMGNLLKIPFAGVEEPGKTHPAIDTLTITEFLQGGDNILAVETHRSTPDFFGLMLGMTVIMDTSKAFPAKFTKPAAVKGTASPVAAKDLATVTPEPDAEEDTGMVGETIAQAEPGTPVSSVEKKRSYSEMLAEYNQKYGSKEELYTATQNYQVKAKRLRIQSRRLATQVNTLKTQVTSTAQLVEKTREEIKLLKREIDKKNRSLN